MGYTNYWNPSKKLKKETDAFPQLMLDEMTKVVEAYNAKQKKEEMKISFYITQKHIDLYGEPATYESLNFSLEKEERIGRAGVDAWTFCKTAREPYDVVVKTFLVLMQKYGLIDSWSHDDNNSCSEYRKARNFAKKLGIDFSQFNARD